MGGAHELIEPVPDQRPLNPQQPCQHTRPHQVLFARREPKSFAESVRQLGRWYAEGKLRPHVSQTFPLEKAAEALKLMAARQVKGKVVLRVGG